MREFVPPALIAAAIGLSWSGVLDRAGLVGASDGLALGAAICLPIWLLNLYRKSRRPPGNGR